MIVEWGALWPDLHHASGGDIFTKKKAGARRAEERRVTFPMVCEKLRA